MNSFIVSHFFAAMFINLFHSISLVKSAFSAIFHSIKNAPATIFSVSGFCIECTPELLPIYLGILSSCSLCLFRLSGGDSENNTQGCGLLQIRLNYRTKPSGPVPVPAAVPAAGRDRARLVGLRGFPDVQPLAMQVLRPSPGCACPFASAGTCRAAALYRR